MEAKPMSYMLLLGNYFPNVMLQILNEMIGLIIGDRKILVLPVSLFFVLYRDVCNALGRQF